MASEPLVRGGKLGQKQVVPVVKHVPLCSVRSTERVLAPFRMDHIASADVGLTYDQWRREGAKGSCSPTR